MKQLEEVLRQARELIDKGKALACTDNDEGEILRQALKTAEKGKAPAHDDTGGSRKKTPGKASWKPLPAQPFSLKKGATTSDAGTPCKDVVKIRLLGGRVQLGAEDYLLHEFVRHKSQIGVSIILLKNPLNPSQNEARFLQNLPPEIITEIFLRLPAVSIPISKCVCKRWLHLLEPDDFIESHFARSAPALVVLGDSGGLKVLELEGELDLHLDPLTQYDFPYHPRKIINCVNGFLILRKCGFGVLMESVDWLCVCNPITREVIKLDLPPLMDSQHPSSEEVVAFGFGASKITGRYKAVIIKSNDYDEESDCHVYTLGTGSWRRLEGIPGVYQFGEGAFVNGNLYWKASIRKEATWISCFDVETECFSFFKAPPYDAQGLPFLRGMCISAMSGCLWFCKVASEYGYGNDGGRRELTIWIMKEYGVDESWSEEYVIPIDDGMSFVEPIEVFENGDLSMLVMAYSKSRCLFHYSNKTKTMQRIDCLVLTVSSVGFSLPPLFHSKL
ncbi:F-box protein CPR1-like [Salvia miltiorrhiza]|uniref:F-box protein CPR1-like n=1 Tax=Salvia miltiorrhiza TaxID=226208 RepID=UPI0025AD9A35|nr:F-box protein CPR1-like [Salvia miltiorrhiza]